MKCSLPLAIALFASFWFGSGPAFGQLFGERTLGRPLARRANSSSSSSRTSSSRGQTESPRLFDESTFENVGALDENARYVRGNRDISDFVGADTNESRRFVGSQLAETALEIRSAVDDLEIETGEDANASALPPVTDRLPLNPPRLQLGFTPVMRLRSEIGESLTLRVRKTLSVDDSLPFEIAVEDDVVILSGQVASPRERKLAELLVRLEPGVNSIENRLQVKAPPPIPRDVPLAPQPAER